MRHFWNLVASWGPAGVFAAAAIESLGIPNPGGTDVLLVAVTIARPTLWIWCALLAVLGSLIGTAVFFEVTRRGGEKFLAQRTTSGRGARFKAWFQRYGLLTVFIPGLLPIPFLPFKFFAACAGAMGVTRTRFLLVLLAARVPRYLGLAYLGAQLGENSLAWLKGHTWHLAAFAVVLFVLLYAMVRFSDRKTAGTIG
ncbi:MAG TPA: VTT domain-containing protein [Bryobacteraceae bacterium]|nr:VTT domain-containing protein [Bryobacteraceae bacterium]